MWFWFLCRQNAALIYRNGRDVSQIKMKVGWCHVQYVLESYFYNCSILEQPRLTDHSYATLSLGSYKAVAS